MTWVLQVGQNKGTECNEVRHFLLNVVVVTSAKRNKEETALMDYGNHLPHRTARCFFCDIHWNLTDSTDIENIEIKLEVFSSVSILKLKSSIEPTFTSTERRSSS